MENRADAWHGDAHPLPGEHWTIVGAVRRGDPGPLIASLDGRLRIDLRDDGDVAWCVDERWDAERSRDGGDLAVVAMRRRAVGVELWANGRTLASFPLRLFAGGVVSLMRKADDMRRDFTVYGLELPDATLERRCELHREAEALPSAA